MNKFAKEAGIAVGCAAGVFALLWVGGFAQHYQLRFGSGPNDPPVSPDVVNQWIKLLVPVVTALLIPLYRNASPLWQAFIKSVATQIVASSGAVIANVFKEPAAPAPKPLDPLAAFDKRLKDIEAAIAAIGAKE